jgi:hypothetical protein
LPLHTFCFVKFLTADIARRALDTKHIYYKGAQLWLDVNWDAQTVIITLTQSPPCTSIDESSILLHVMVCTWYSDPKQQVLGHHIHIQIPRHRDLVAHLSVIVTPS